MFLGQSYLLIAYFALLLGDAEMPQAIQIGIEMRFEPNRLRQIRGTGIAWVNDGEGLGLSTHLYERGTTDSLIISLGYNCLRIPGGYLARNFNWRLSIGNVRGTSTNFEGRQEKIQAGLREMKEFAARYDMQVMYTLNMSDSPSDIVDLLRAWNCLPPVGRAEIKFVELGNEDYDRDPTENGAQRYSQKAISIISAIRKFDRTVRIGAIMSNPQKSTWDKTVLGQLKDSIDFLILHRYVPYSPYDEIDSFEKTLMSLHQIEEELRNIEVAMGEKHLPIILTEYNLSFYRHNEHQNVVLSPRYYLAAGNFLLLAIKNRISGLVKWTLSNPRWHVFADINFNGTDGATISLGGMVSSMLNSWLADQDSVTWASTSAVDEYRFSILIGKKRNNDLSFLIQNHTQERKSVHWKQLRSYKLGCYFSIYQTADGKQLWTDRRGAGVVDTMSLAVPPCSLTRIDFIDDGN